VVINFFDRTDSNCSWSSGKPSRALRLEDIYIQPRSSHGVDKQVEKLKTLLRDFQEHCEQFGAIECRKQTVKRRVVEMDCEIRGKRKVKGEIFDHISTSANRERGERIEKSDKKYSDHKPTPNIRTPKRSACMRWMIFEHYLKVMNIMENRMVFSD
jgi:hypothetical protein